MKTYFVKWEIDIDAENAQEAAKKALEIQRDPTSRATVFDVIEEDSDESERIDLDEYAN